MPATRLSAASATSWPALPLKQKAEAMLTGELTFSAVKQWHEIRLRVGRRCVGRSFPGAIYQFSGGAGTGLPCMRFDTLPPCTTVHHIGRLVRIWMASMDLNSWLC